MINVVGVFLLKNHVITVECVHLSNVPECCYCWWCCCCYSCCWNISRCAHWKHMRYVNKWCTHLHLHIYVNANAHAHTHQEWSSSLQRYCENKKVDAPDVFRASYKHAYKSTNTPWTNDRTTERWTNDVKTNAKQDKEQSKAKHAIDAMHWWKVAASYCWKYNCTI